MESITKSALARHLGVTPQRVSQYVKRGLPTLADGKLDLDAALAWLAVNGQTQAVYQDRGVHKAGAKPRPNAEDAVPCEPGIGTDTGSPDAAYGTFGLMSYTDARAKRESMIAHKAQLDLDERRGLLLDAGEVKRVWLDKIVNCRGRILAVPARVAAALPHLTVADVAKIDAEVRLALAEMAE
jgi:phage terminase Nu1 subunit (DNA packaging protein)